MRDATYVVVALALCMLILLMYSLDQTISMMDLYEFKKLPFEVRLAVKRFLPNPVEISHKWKLMSNDQKRLALSQIVGMFPRHEEPMPMPAPAPEPEPEPAPEPEVPPPPPLKKGFLLGDAKKKNSDNKKKNKVVTLSSVAPDDNASGDGFLGSDQ
jgi:hypothetical protein